MNKYQVYAKFDNYQQAGKLNDPIYADSHKEAAQKFLDETPIFGITWVGVLDEKLTLYTWNVENVKSPRYRLVDYGKQI